HDFGDAALMCVVGVGMHETNADGANTMRPIISSRLAHAFLVEGTQFVAVKVQPATDLANKLQRYNALGLDPEIGIAIALWHRLPRDFEDMPKAGCDDQA